MMALWLWQSRAWTEPQSALISMWLGLQGVLAVLCVGAVVMLVRSYRRQ